MERIPTIKEIENKYEQFKDEGKGLYALTALERVVLAAPRLNLTGEYNYRRRLRAVLKEGLKTPRNENMFYRFLETYGKGEESRLELSIWLSDAIIEAKANR